MFVSFLIILAEFRNSNESARRVSEVFWNSHCLAYHVAKPDDKIVEKELFSNCTCFFVITTILKSTKNINYTYWNEESAFRT